LKAETKSEGSAKSGGGGINNVMKTGDPKAFDTYISQMLEKTINQISG